jgi:hypothetical protein
MLSVSNDFKTTIRNNAVYSDGYVVIKDNDSFNETYDSDELNLIEIMNDVFKNDSYIGEIGQCALKVNLLGDNTSLLPLDRELTIEVYLGIKVGASYEYVKYQDFILLEAKYNESTNLTEILATDKLLLLNQDFVDTNTYPMNLGDYVESVLTYCGLELNDKTWVNNDYVLDSQPFETLFNAREIITKASELAMSFVVINPTNNKVIFNNFYTKLTTNAFDEEIDEDEFYKLKLRDKNLGSNGVNTLVLKISQVEGENNTVENATNVAIDGNIEISIVDNDLVNEESKRLEVIDNMFDLIDGLNYQPLELEYRGFPYLELGDVIKVVGNNGTYYFPILEIMLRYNGGLFGTLKADSLINTETRYRNVTSDKQRLRSAEIKVDKVLGEVQIIAENEVAIAVGNIRQGGNNLLLNGDISSGAISPFINVGIGGSVVNDTTLNRNVIRINKASGVILGVAQIVPYITNTQLVASFNARLISGVDSMVIRAQILDASNNVLSNALFKDINITSSYQRYEYTFNSGNVTSGVNIRLQFFSPATASSCDIYMYNFSLQEGNKSTEFSPNKNEMRTSKYVFDGEKARFYSDGQEWYDASNNLRVSFDTVNNRFVFNGEIISESGTIADFSLIPDYSTVVAGTSGKALTAGSGTTRVGMSPGVTTGGFTYSLWAGNDNPINAPFRVLRNGGLRSTDAIIAGWTMSGTSISRGNTIFSASGTNGTLSLNGAVLTGVSSGLIELTGSLRTTSGLIILGTSNLRNVIARNIDPETTNTYDIGVSSQRWRTIFLVNNPNVSSDIRWKENVKVVEDEYTDMILNTEVIEYNIIGSENKQIGINANKFHEQFGEKAELITKLDENGYYGADYVSFVPMLIKTVQSQQKEIDELKARLDKLEKLLK